MYVVSGLILIWTVIVWSIKGKRSFNLILDDDYHYTFLEILLYEFLLNEIS